MKKLASILVLMALIGTTTAEARKRRTASADGSDFWVGFSTDGIVSPTGAGSLSALIDFSESFALQGYFGISSISPNFLFGAGGNVKFTVVGDSSKGFHVGGGLGLGTTTASAFFLRFGALLGLHFELVKNVMIVADGGFFTTITTPSTVNLGLGPNSGTLGLSILFGL